MYARGLSTHYVCKRGVTERDDKKGSLYTASLGCMIVMNGCHILEKML